MIILIAIIINKMYIGFGDKEEETKGVNIKEEGLADYWSAIDPKTKPMQIGREKYYQDKYPGFLTFTDDSFPKMIKARPAALDKRIQGVQSYRLTDNLAYRQAFQFEPPQLNEHDQIIRSSDKFMYSYNTQGDLVNDPEQSDIAYLTLFSGFIPPANDQPFKYIFSPKGSSDKLLI